MLNNFSNTLYDRTDMVAWLAAGRTGPTIPVLALQRKVFHNYILNLMNLTYKGQNPEALSHLGKRKYTLNGCMWLILAENHKLTCWNATL